MHVLLISPVAHLDPPCGDITYTANLLAHPPEGVTYETYDEAIARGNLEEFGRRKSLRSMPVLTLANALVNKARALGLIFWEPFRFFRVRPGVYDLIHTHVFNVRFLSDHPPLIVTSGAPQTDLYRDRRNFGPLRLALCNLIEKFLRWVFAVNHNSLGMPQASAVAVYTEHYRSYLSQPGYVSPARTFVVPLMQPRNHFSKPERHPRTIGFVANSFFEKGGDVLLQAFELLRRTRANVNLVIVGSEAPTSELAALPNVTWCGRVSREDLLSSYMPSFDIFAYPTKHDCFSYVVLEAMATGVPVATSDYISMPEAVDYGRAGLISRVGDAQGLYHNLLKLLEPETNRHFGANARARFASRFSTEAVLPMLRSVYSYALANPV